MTTKSTSALEELIELEHDARAFGFEWENSQMIVDQALSECQEINEAIIKQESPARIQEEIGDLLHTALSLCLFMGFDPLQTLAFTVNKFAERMSLLKELTHEEGLKNLKGQQSARMLTLWERVKDRQKGL